MKITDEEGRSWAVQRILEGMPIGEIAAILSCTKTELQEVLYHFRDEVLWARPSDELYQRVDRVQIEHCAAMTRRGELIKSKLRTIFVDTPRSIFAGSIYVLRIAIVIFIFPYMIWAFLSGIVMVQPFENRLDRTVLNCKGTMRSDHQTRSVEVDAIMEEYAWHSLELSLLFGDDNKWIKIWVQTEDPIYMYSFIGEEDKYWKRRISGDATGSFSRFNNELILDIKNHETSDKGKVSFTFKGKCVIREM
jgi:hypothetical protein